MKRNQRSEIEYETSQRVELSLFSLDTQRIAGGEGEKRKSVKRVCRVRSLKAFVMLVVGSSGSGRGSSADTGGGGGGCGCGVMTFVYLRFRFVLHFVLCVLLPPVPYNLISVSVEFSRMLHR
jgi:hypothetical protein